MISLYRCDYCDFIGSSEEVIQHETTCIKNPARCSCNYCEYAFFPTSKTVKCDLNKEKIDDNHILINCDAFKAKDFSNPFKTLSDILFKGVNKNEV